MKRPTRWSTGATTHPHTIVSTPSGGLSGVKVAMIAMILCLSSLLVIYYHHSLTVMEPRRTSPRQRAQQHQETTTMHSELLSVDKEPTHHNLRTTLNDEAVDTVGDTQSGPAASPLSGVEDTFAVVLLSYRSPKSLQNTLRSLCRAALHTHPKFSEIVVYFQVYDEYHDKALVHAILGSDGPWGPIPHRVIGSKENLPVALATFRALRSVASEYVLYLECDRPIMSFPSMSEKQLQEYVALQIDIALASLSGQTPVAQWFRMQLYSSDLLNTLNAKDERLPETTYGSIPFQHCQHVLRYHSDTSLALPLDHRTSEILLPLLNDSKSLNDGLLGAQGICNNKAAAKKKHGNVFYTAYCKHWTKLQKTTPSEFPQQDMCDSFCFLQWASALLDRHPDQIPDHQSAALEKIEKKFRAGTTLHTISLAMKNSSRTHSSSSSGSEQQKEHHRVVCTDSSWCNWSNQPSFYKRDWYLNSIALPCESTKQGMAYCIGGPGRQSAVRQELFFVKHREHWATKRYKVCIGKGLFIHHEVDNRE